jgi:hypothetical protein
MKKLLKGEELEEYAKKIGVDIQGDLIFQSASGRQKRASDYELQRRVQEAERSKRENRLWLMALISALASLVSAITAIIAISTK